jgi:glyoxylase-like metal-dependent hydrolase (beta-lactamase superfamily II)
MMTKERFPEISKFLAERGVSFITDIRTEGRGAAIANTYLLESSNKCYMIDAACGKERLKQIKNHLPNRPYDLLVTHSHLDHSANSGAAVDDNARIIFHPRVEDKINNLRRNYTEITPAMINAFGVRGFFGRTGMLSPAMIDRALFIQKHMPHLFKSLLQITAWQMLRANIGTIHTPRKNVHFLPGDDRRELDFAGITFWGWSIDEGIFALDTPGHQDDHIAIYVPDKKIMFAGDLVNFLNPNDILDGSLKDTQTNMIKMLQLAEAGGIDILAVSHALPVIGKDNVISHIRSVIAEQDEVFEIVASIVSAHEDKNDFEGIIKKIYAHEAELMKKVLRINYPRSVSFIDVYVLIYLREFN